MRIDVYAHILTEKYAAALGRTAAPGFQRRLEANPGLSSLEVRFRIMDRYPGLMQVLSMASPAVDSVAAPAQAAELARLANDELADLVVRYPDRFPAAIAVLPMNNIEAALDEIDRAITQLRMRGVLLYTPCNGKALDQLEFEPVFEKMARYNLPIFIHPGREDVPDYPGEGSSKYGIWRLFGWPYDTTAAMCRIVFSGLLDKYPSLKVITHHAGGLVPFSEQRIPITYDLQEMRFRDRAKDPLTRPVLDYFRLFYNDTAVAGSVPALMCAYSFFGAKHLLFGTDTPFDNLLGERVIRQTIEGINAMPIQEGEKQKIFADNARELLRLPV